MCVPDSEILNLTCLSTWAEGNGRAGPGPPERWQALAVGLCKGGEPQKWILLGGLISPGGMASLAREAREEREMETTGYEPPREAQTVVAGEGGGVESAEHVGGLVHTDEQALRNEGGPSNQEGWGGTSTV